MADCDHGDKNSGLVQSDNVQAYAAWRSEIRSFRDRICSQLDWIANECDCECPGTAAAQEPRPSRVDVQSASEAIAEADADERLAWLRRQLTRRIGDDDAKQE